MLASNRLPGHSHSTAPAASSEAIGCRVQTWRFILAPNVAALRSAVDLCRPRKLIKLRYAVLSERVGVLVVASANACAKREERQCNDSGNYLGRHGYFLLVSEARRFCRLDRPRR
jgi:hypothetical protein